MSESEKKLEMKSVRLEALGDGIFAIAMTIMVLELRLPEIEGDGLRALWLSFYHAWHGFVCYGVSFVVLGIMWFGHRMMFEFIGRTNRYFIFIGVLFYMFVCLVPFSTKILAEYTMEWFAIVIYAVNLSLCNLTLYAQWLYGIKRASLLERPVPQTLQKDARFLFLISPFVYTIAAAISFWMPALSIAMFVVTPILYILPNKIDRYLP